MTAHVHVIATQHLDVAWLWTRAPVGEDLMRQCLQRAVEMIEADPDGRFVFSRSTAWSFRIIEQRWPDLFERLRPHVAAGRIELCGGEWVEPDHLIPDGESLIRQCALGQWYYLDRFGRTATVCWDPDIFGHPHSLPQILRGCGLEGFYSHRCRPRRAGRPLQQFIWRGPDGSRVFYLAGQWIGRPDTQAIRNALDTNPQPDLPSCHVATGLASDRRITMNQSWLPLPSDAEEALGLGSCRWSSAADVLEDMKTYGDRLPVVEGELGFQFTGTYTSNLQNKVLNRRAERLLTTAEKAAAWAASLGWRYPTEQLTQAWRDHCVNQFHDVICGCSVAAVHREDRELWADVLRRARTVREEALAFLADRLHAADPLPGDEGGQATVVFNLLGWARDGVVELDLAPEEDLEACDNHGRSLAVQVTAVDGRRRALIRMPAVPGIGCERIRVRRVPAARRAVAHGSAAPVLENDFVRVEIDPTSGELTRLLDKTTGLECLCPGGRGNRWVLLGDDDAQMPSWTIRYTGERTAFAPADRVELIEDGSVRRTVRVERTMQPDPDRPPTVLVQDIILEAHSPVLRFETRGQWHATKRMLKAEFDLAFECDVVVAEAPYAAVRRLTTPPAATPTIDADTAAEDAGRDGRRMDDPGERYMQKWLDAGDGQRGLLFLSDGPCGYDASPTRVRLSLLRSPPDSADHLEDAATRPTRQVTGLGPVAFSYGLVAHAGDWRTADAPRRGYEFAAPLLTRPLRSAVDGAGPWRDWWDRLDELHPAGPTFVQAGQSNGVLLTVVKQAEDGRGTILRLAETLGGGGSIRLVFEGTVRSARRCDMLERIVPGEEALSPSADGHGLELALKPWEILTVRVSLSSG